MSVVNRGAELVDDLRMQDIQVTGLSIPIVVRIELKRHQNNREFVSNTFSGNSVRFLLQYTDSICKDPGINLCSVLYQHNCKPVISYTSQIKNRIRVGGKIEDEICSRLAAIYGEANAPNIVKQLSWYYLFDQKLEYIIHDWTQIPLVHYMLYTITPTDEQLHQPFCEPATKWIICLRGNIIAHLLAPTPENVSAFREFLDNEDEALLHLFHTDSTEVRVHRSQAVFIPAGWIYIIKREQNTIEYGGEFFHSYAIETQIGVWHLYKDVYLDGSDSVSPFVISHWLVLQAYLSSFQDTMLTTKEDGFSLEDNQDMLPHFSPFECRGMLFLIELLRSGRFPLLKKCIPSSVNCAVSLLQKIQTIILHENIFSTFSSSTPNGIMFVGTPNLTNVYQSKNRDNNKKVKRPLAVEFSSIRPEGTCAEVPESYSEITSSKYQSLNVSIQLKNVDEFHPDNLSLQSHSSTSTNYLSVMSESSKSAYVPVSQDSDLISESSDLNNEILVRNEVKTLKLSPGPIEVFLSSYLTPEVLENCELCQYCKYNTHPKLNRKCLLYRIADETASASSILYAPPVFLRLVQLLRVYAPLSPNSFLNTLLGKIVKISTYPVTLLSESSLVEIQNAIMVLQTPHDSPLNQSTPFKL
ncbi:JmjC domain-containing histone demethylation protein 1-like [Oopsacas minuta]|uniref:JmjC domain-containing histone demethylation protein 1-like n=1 Tax=Oopsacas minuta TaxID=111878 RepID=A0AAV7K6Y5_9METZ|nr:JmjC domain-containing histone demethylation protein 1-like [Oopsacas minuta]